MLKKSVSQFHTPGYAGHVPGIRTQDAVGRSVRQLLTCESVPTRIPPKKNDMYVPGYSGYMPGVSAENIYGASAYQKASEKLQSDGMLSSRETQRQGTHRPGIEIPGYTGHVTGKIDASVMGATYRNTHDQVAVATGKAPSKSISRPLSEIGSPRSARRSEKLGSPEKLRYEPGNLSPQAFIVGYSGHLAGQAADPTPGTSRSRSYAYQAQVNGFDEEGYVRQPYRLEVQSSIPAEVPGYTGHRRGRINETSTVGKTYKRAADPTVLCNSDPTLPSEPKIRTAITGYKGFVPQQRFVEAKRGAEIFKLSQPNRGAEYNAPLTGRSAYTETPRSARSENGQLGAWQGQESRNGGSPGMWSEDQSQGGRPQRTLPGDSLRMPGGSKASSRASSRASSPGAESNASYVSRGSRTNRSDVKRPHF